MTTEPIRYLAEESWRRARKGAVIGGSDVPILLGLVPTRWGTPFTLWSFKVGLLDQNEENEAMSWGNALERTILEKWAKDYLIVVRHSQYEHYAHPDEPRYKYSPDGFELEPETKREIALVEVKNVSVHMGWQWEEGPPAKVVAQVQFGMACTGMPMAHCVALIGGNRCAHYVVMRDEKWLETHQETFQEFLRLVELEEPPEPVGENAEDEALAAAWDSAPPADRITLDDDYIDTHDELRETVEMITVLNRKKKRLRQVITMAMAGATAAEIPGVPGYYRYNAVKRRGYTVQPQEIRMLRYMAPRGKKREEEE